MKALSQVFLGIVLALSQPAAFAKDPQERQTLQVAYEYFDASLPLSVAKANAMFEKHGIAVQFNDLSGQYRFHALKYDIVFGKGFGIFSQDSAKPDVIRFCLPYAMKKDGDAIKVLAVKKRSIKRFEDLKGKRVVLPGGESHLFTLRILPKYGMQPSDITMYGGGRAVAEFPTSDADALYCFKSDVLPLVRKHSDTIEIFSQNLECQFYNDPYYCGCVWLNWENYKAHPEAFRGFLNAIDEAIDLIRAKPRDSLRSLPNLFPKLDPEEAANMGVFHFHKTSEPPEFGTLQKQLDKDLKAFYRDGKE